jgi:hypothetical protein
MANAGVLYFFRDIETEVSPHSSVFHDDRKIVWSGWKLIPAVP